MTKQAGDRAGRGYHHGNLRPALVEAGLRILERDGLAGLSLRAVAREAGVSRAAPYHHFANRDALLAAIAAQAFKSLEDSVAAFDGVSGTVEERLREIARGYVGFAVGRPEIYRLLFGTEIGDKSAYPELQAAGTASYAAFARQIAALRAEHGTGGADDRLAGLAVWTMLHGLAMAAIEGRLDAAGGAATPEDLAAGLVDVLLKGF
jgi:AcrR family transcriptional regulator